MCVCVRACSEGSEKGQPTPTPCTFLSLGLASSPLAIPIVSLLDSFEFELAEPLSRAQRAAVAMATMPLDWGVTQEMCEVRVSGCVTHSHTHTLTQTHTHMVTHCDTHPDPPTPPYTHTHQLLGNVKAADRGQLTGQHRAEGGLGACVIIHYESWSVVMASMNVCACACRPAWRQCWQGRRCASQTQTPPLMGASPVTTHHSMEMVRRRLGMAWLCQ